MYAWLNCFPQNLQLFPLPLAVWKCLIVERHRPFMPHFTKSYSICLRTKRRYYCHQHRPHIDPTSTLHRPHIDPASTLHRPHIDPTSTSHRPHNDLTSTLHRPHIDLTSTSHRPYIDLTSTPRRPHIDMWPQQKIINKF